MGAWSVYMVRSAAGALYTGISIDVPGRLVAHGEGRGAKCLRGRGPLELVYRRRLGEQGLALRVERALKRLSKREKEALALADPSRRSLLNRLGVEPRPVAAPRLPSRAASRPPARASAAASSPGSGRTRGAPR